MIEPDNYTDDEGREQNPGFLGLIFDGDAAFEAALAPLSGFDFWTYAQLADELEAVERCVVVDFGSGATELCFDASSVEQINLAPSKSSRNPIAAPMVLSSNRPP